MGSSDKPQDDLLRRIDRRLKLPLHLATATPADRRWIRSQ